MDPLFNDPWASPPQSKSNRPGAKWVQDDYMGGIISDASQELTKIKSKIASVGMLTIIFDKFTTVECRQLVTEDKFKETLLYLKETTLTLTNFESSKIFVKKLCQAYNYEHPDKKFFTPLDISGECDKWLKTKI